MSANDEDNKLDDATTNLQQKQFKRPQQQNDYNCPPQITGMTPSIITTINNTSPHPPEDYYPSINHNYNNNSNNGNNSTKSSRRTTEPYESYIEDSFVGHWEREDDDDLNCEYSASGRQGLTRGNIDEDEDSALQHASTLEFDFDSFGPESIIYTPTTLPHSNTTTNKTTANTTPESVTPTINNDIPTNLNESNEVKLVAPVRIVQEAPVKSEEKETSTYVSSPRSQSAINPVDYLVDPTQIDLKVIEPYKKVISHAGYCHHFDSSAPQPKPGEPAPAIIVFSACYLPDRSRRDYNYVMDHLFLYVLTSLHELIADDYILIYLHNTQPSKPSVNMASAGGLTNSSSSSTANGEDIQHPNNLPTFTWMKRCYQMIDRKLRKNLKILYLVKPTFWLKTIVIMCKPFISSKFSRKLRFVENMDELKRCLPVEKLILPASADNI